MAPKKSKTCSSADNDNFLTSLPEDFLLQILNKLPAEALIKLISVSKRFKSQIRNPQFIEAHLSSIQNSPKHLLSNSVSWSQEQRVLVSNSPNYSYNYSWNSFTLGYSEYKGKLVGTVRGVVCMEHGLDLILWNPSICKIRLFPRKTIGISDWWLEFGFGLGFDHVNLDFKIVQISYHNQSKIGWVMVYGVKSGCWKSVTAKVPCYIPASFCHQAYSVCVNGIVYWLASETNDHIPSCTCIMGFDLVGEVFTVMELPHGCPDTFQHCRIKLSTSSDGKSLVVFVTVRTDSKDPWNWSVWYLGKDFNWEKRYNLAVDQHYKYFIPQCIIYDEVVLVLVGSMEGLYGWVRIDCKEGGGVDLSSATVASHAGIMDFNYIAYTPSLALLLSDDHMKQEHI